MASPEPLGKALLRYHNHEVRGYTLVHLLKTVQDFAVLPDLWPRVRELDRHYIQPRYPNGFATGYPAEFYDQETAERALAYGTEILGFVQSHLA